MGEYFMSYTKMISRREPGLIELLLDNSPSMRQFLAGTSDPKFQWVERYAGHILKQLLAQSSTPVGDEVVIKPRYYLHTVLYGGTAQVWGDGLMDIQTAVARYAEAGNSFGLAGQIDATDTANAFACACDFWRQALADEKFRNSFPPMLFHLTDGESQTDASAIADQVKRLKTNDGKLLIVNAFIGAETSLGYHGPEDFPGYVSRDEAGPNSYSERLFDMSSEMPPCIQQNLINDCIFPVIRPGARLFFDVRTKEMLKHVIQVVGSVGSRGPEPVTDAGAVG
jgi:hypothetical protein